MLLDDENQKNQNEDDQFISSTNPFYHQPSSSHNLSSHNLPSHHLPSHHLPSHNFENIPQAYLAVLKKINEMRW